MVAIQGVAHSSIRVSDIARSTRFYTEVVGCRHLSTVPRGDMAFLDAAGTCLILVKRDAPINPVPDDHGGVHHAFAIEHEEYKAALDHLALMASRSRSRRTGEAACSTDRAPIFTIPTARCWSSSIWRATPAIEHELRLRLLRPDALFDAAQRTETSTLNAFYR